MSVLGVPKMIVSESVKLARKPLDFTLETIGLRQPTVEEQLADDQRERASQLREEADRKRREADE